MNNLGFYKLVPQAKLPTYGTTKAACFDFYSCDEDKYLFPGDSKIFNLGLIVEIPVGYSLRIHPRSGLAFNHNVTLVNAEGIIDYDYVDELKVKLFRLDDQYENNDNEPIIIKSGDRIAQGELVKNELVYIYESYERPKRKDTMAGGFRSTGK